MTGLASVVIPAHNEQQVIGRCLARLMDGLPPDTQVVVVCNGCTDDTAGIAATFGARLVVVEVDRPSKTGALNAGDGVASGFPRAYLDADIEVSGHDLDQVARRMIAAGAHAGDRVCTSCRNTLEPASRHFPTSSRTTISSTVTSMTPTGCTWLRGSSCCGPPPTSQTSSPSRPARGRANAS